MLYKISFFCLFCFSLFSIEDVYLKTPHISQQNVMGTNVGIRPYRKTGVRLEAEKIRDKLIIHNYGYGGAGMTLAFGGAHEVLEILEKQKNSSKVVAVLGGGVVGLVTAYELLERGYEVHLYAEKWHPDLTSNVAVGIWTPLTFPKETIPLEKQKQHQNLLEIAEQRFVKSTGDHPEFAGVRWTPYYLLAAEGPQGEEVLVHFDNGIAKRARRDERLTMDGKLFMEDLYSKVKGKGALLQQKHFENLDEVLGLKEPVIINCMSMGSREVFDDREFIPVRGQLVYFKPQEEIDFVLFQAIPHSNYAFLLSSWHDRLVLGGIFEEGEEELKAYPETIDQMIQNAEKCLSGEW